MRMFAKFIFCTCMGWRIQGDLPSLKKYVIIVVPHTSWHDFYIGLLVRKILATKINYIGKKELFRPPYGWFFRWQGGTPIDRHHRSNTVDAIAQLFQEHDEFRLALSPEGTRKKVNQWRTGFYFIAKKAIVPIVMVAFDFGKKKVIIAPPFYPTDSQEKDFEYMYRNFKGVEGKNKENSFEVE
ncbi:1-acyl-sn-glycerol-3-phosphate acyltransferase [Imtechella halotolerans]|uniref:Phospholipid/glycerol acyltransferase n=1 Tax=Imtechella halotolerans K1 TaxID=946077 RepID=I0WG36_9FLAO|nr:1-acyl-sn-glycerol-3-phosphate acyltransferase [Imtechella halotolerans]EID75352.1 phospholipid/glycerol acyltransferase [Imtechella halotolerans K1]WMQ63726.1 1-acyl-sn-glycerol-3-phosphate acyltransferase [Imtechella halotolerans]